MNVGTLGTIVMTAAQAKLVYRAPGPTRRRATCCRWVVVKNNGSTVNVKVFLDGNADVWLPGIAPADVTAV